LGMGETKVVTRGPKVIEDMWSASVTDSKGNNQAGGEELTGGAKKEGFTNL